MGIREWFGRKADAAPTRFDSWENAYMGYGTFRDKVSQGAHFLTAVLDDAQLASLFYTDDIAAKLIEKRPEEAFRRGYELEDTDDGERAAKLLATGKDLDIDGKMQEAMTWARCYGSALVIMGIEGGNPATPLDEKSARAVRFLNVVDRRWIFVESYYRDPMSPKYGEPEVYRVNGLDGRSTLVHETRCLRFDGVRVDAQKRLELGGWSYSVLQRPYDVMRQFATAFQAAGILTADASQAVFKMKGLMQMIASGEKERLQTRMQLVDMSRSSARAVLLDADGEDFQRIATQFQGLPEMLDRFAARLSASFDMPVTLLMGTTPAGDNATGASDFKHWYDSIASEQEKSISPKLIRFYRILSQGVATKLKVCWRPLEEPSEVEKATVEKTEADTWKVYIDAGVLYPQEVALAQFGKDTNGQIEIDEDERATSLEAEKELAANPPPLVAPPGAASPSTGTSATGAAPSGKPPTLPGAKAT